MKVTGEGGTPEYINTTAAGKMFHIVIGDDEIPYPLEVALLTMKDKEVAQFDISAFVNTKKFLNIPRNMPIQYTIHIIDIQNTPEPPPEQRYTAALKRKEDGNSFFNNRKYELAIRKYCRAIEIANGLPLDQKLKGRKEIDLGCYLNMAACDLIVKDYKSAIQYSTKALEIDSTNVKGLWRRGVAHTETGEWIEAENDFKAALEYADQASQKKIKNSLDDLKRRMAEQDRKDKERFQNIFNDERNRFYEVLYNEIQELLSKERDLIANTANVASTIHHQLNKKNDNKINWTGFYFILQNGQLLLGPFQGKMACSRIGWGEGVCGAAVEKKQTIIVPNTQKFNGDTTIIIDTNSEIALPIFWKGTVVGVLEINSLVVEGFDDHDKEGLEKIVSLLSTNCKWHHLQRLHSIENSKNLTNQPSNLALGITVVVIVGVSFCVWKFLPSFKKLKY